MGAAQSKAYWIWRAVKETKLFSCQAVNVSRPNGDYRPCWASIQAGESDPYSQTGWLLGIDESCDEADWVLQLSPPKSLESGQCVVVLQKGEVGDLLKCGVEADQPMYYVGATLA